MTEKEFQVDKNPTSPFVPGMWSAQRDTLDPGQRERNGGDSLFARGFFQCTGCFHLLQVYRVDTWIWEPCPKCKQVWRNPLVGLQQDNKITATATLIPRILYQCGACHNFASPQQDKKELDGCNSKSSSSACTSCNRRLVNPYFGNLFEDPSLSRCIGIFFAIFLNGVFCLGSAGPM